MKNLTRQQLYDLLWTKPTRDVAKELGVSDVWIGKVCRRAGIPKPSPGYWQQLASGKAVRKVRLPTALPLHVPNMFVLGAGSRVGYSTYFEWSPPKSDDEPLPPPPEPPVFSEPIDDVRKRAESLVAGLKFTECAAIQHPAIVKLLEGDERRAKRNAGSYWAANGPWFRHPSGQELLKGLNKLFCAWTRLGGEVFVDGIVNQSISVRVLGQRLPLGFVDYRWDGTRIDPRSKPKGKYGLFWGYNYDNRVSPSTLKSYREYDAITTGVLRSLIVESILLAEQDNRSAQQHAFKYVMGCRNDVLHGREQRRLAEIRRREEQIQELKQKRLDLIEVVIARIAKANRLRDLVRAFDQTVAQSVALVPGYDPWRKWVTELIEEVDPLRLSAQDISRWVGQFDLES